MENTFKIPHGDDKITIELTVKEAMALSGARFNGEQDFVYEARRKLRETVTGTLSPKDSVH